MSKATFGQAMQALNLIHSKNKTVEELEQFYQSGLLSDILDADLKEINRNDFREYLGLPRTGFNFIAEYIPRIEILIQKYGIKHFDDRITNINVPFAKVFSESKMKIKAEIHTFVRNGTIVGLHEFGLHNRHYCQRRLAERGVRGATIEELISFNKYFPNESKKRRIFAPASATNLESGATYHFDDYDGRFKCMVYLQDGALDLSDESDWTNHYVLAIRD